LKGKGSNYELISTIETKFSKKICELSNALSMQEEVFEDQIQLKDSQIKKLQEKYDSLEYRLKQFESLFLKISTSVANNNTSQLNLNTHDSTSDIDDYEFLDANDELTADDITKVNSDDNKVESINSNDEISNQENGTDSSNKT